MLPAKREVPSRRGRLFGELVDVCTRRERFLTGARQDDDADCRIVSEAQHDAPKLLECVAVQRVQDARSIDRDDGDGVLPIDDQVLEVVARLR